MQSRIETLTQQVLLQPGAAWASPVKTRWGRSVVVVQSVEINTSSWPRLQPLRIRGQPVRSRCATYRPEPLWCSCTKSPWEECLCQTSSPVLLPETKIVCLKKKKLRAFNSKMSYYEWEEGRSAKRLQSTGWALFCAFMWCTSVLWSFAAEVAYWPFC